MIDNSIIHSDFFAWVLLPLLIFFSRILDVSIGTIRLIFVSKGLKYLAPILGFFEVVIWLIAISQIIQNLNNVMGYIAYGLGFAMGNYVGIVLEEKLSIGTILIRVIPKMETSNLIAHLRNNQFAVITVDVEGMSGQVKMLLSIINRKDAKEYIGFVNRFDPKAFYTIENISAVKEGYLRINKPFSVFNFYQLLRRRGK